MQEVTVNLHNHSIFSDGSGNIFDIAQAGLTAGIDVLIMTEHNVLIQEQDKYYHRDGKRLLVLFSEELHNPDAKDGNHLLALNVQRELSSLVNNPQRLINTIAQEGGTSIIAHPFDQGIPIIEKENYAWHDWQVHDYHGLEIYNMLTELKKRATSPFHLLSHILKPDTLLLGPDEEAVQKWDELLCLGFRIHAFAGSDAHQFHKKFGPFHFTIFPYRFHFSALNNHVMIDEPLSGNIETDRALVYDTLRKGRFFLGLDSIHPAHGFELKADGETKTIFAGESMPLGLSATLKIITPRPALIRLIHNGKVIRQWENASSIPWTVTEPGYYRVECYIPYKNKLRGWIFSNPIYLTRG